MIDENQILMTGGSGLLGEEIRKLLPDADYPPHDEFDVESYSQMAEYIRTKEVRMILHAAAFTSPPKAEENPLSAVETNVIGTANVVRLCMEHDLKLIYISTDYVFKGDEGKYGEEDPLYPVNKYAWSKLGGECAVRMYDDSLTIRTSFGPNVFPYERAFVDQWTSRESVAVIAEKIVRVLDRGIRGVLHVGGERKTVYEYAVGLDPAREIEKLSINEVVFQVPVDTSLNCGKYELLFSDREGA